MRLLRCCSSFKFLCKSLNRDFPWTIFVEFKPTMTRKGVKGPAYWNWRDRSPLATEIGCIASHLPCNNFVGMVIISRRISKTKGIVGFFSFPKYCERKYHKSTNRGRMHGGISGVCVDPILNKRKNLF